MIFLSSSAFGGTVEPMGPRFVGLAMMGLAVLTGAGGCGRLRRAGGAAPPPLPAAPREILVGRPLPPLVLADDHGVPVALASLRGKPTVLLFFRASSCPLCRAQLAALAGAAGGFLAAGAEVVAASPDTPATLADLRRELQLPIRLLSDADEQAVNALCGGVAHCQILVDPQGVVRWGAFSESWSHSPSPEALLDAVRSLAPSGT
jgi:peroxiredoxin